MHIKLPYLTRETLDELNCGVYSYNVIGEPELYINKFCLNQLGNLNKIYKTSVEKIINRLIHPEDQNFALIGVQTVSQYPDQIFIHFRRYLINESECRWAFVINGATELTEDGQTKRIQSYSKFLTSDHNELFNCLQHLELLGYTIDSESMRSQLGEELSKQTFDIYSNNNPSDRQKKILSIENSLRKKMNIPDFWTTEMVINFFGAIQISRSISA